jgi:hypothetical protein
MYYPKSQIRTNLFTNGDEYFLSTTGESYKGYYYKTSTGQVFSGKTPDDRPNILLESISSTEWDLTAATENGRNFQQQADNFDGLVYGNEQQKPEIVNTYLSLKPENLNIIIPYYVLPKPTEQDYQIGEFRRYFCKKTNEIIYIEIDKTQYDLLVTQSPDILWQLYTPFNLPWQITGDQEQVARTNKNIVELTSRRLRLPRLGDYLNNNYLKYYR